VIHYAERNQHTRRTALLFIGASALIGLCAGAALAQYPTRPIKLLVHSAPGGAPDLVGRILGEKLAVALGQPFAVENRPGANGNIAGDIVARATPDGHTLLVCVDSMLVINPHVYATMPFDPLKDLVPIATLVSSEFLLAVNAALPVRDFRGFIEYARQANPPLAYASGGNGGQHHLTMEMLKASAGIALEHVPYKGASPAAAALIAGEVAVAFLGSSGWPHVKAGRLRPLAVSGSKRVGAFSDLPTIGEFYPGLSNSIWHALCAPRGTPEPILGRLRTAVNKVLAEPDVKEKFSRGGVLEPYITTPEGLAELVRSEYAKYGKIAKEVGVRVD
jgi:tripartite-type tricarboxylate transporter receptor subunit TctC